MSLVPGGYVHYEGQFFLDAQLDNRPLLSHLFSSHFNEWDCYQGRELSFVAASVDANLLALSARIGAVNLYSLVTCICLLVSAIGLWRVLPAMTGIDSVAAGLVVSLFLTSPVTSLSVFYYRPAKALVAMFLVGVLAVLAHVIRDPFRSKSRLLLLAALATAMGLSDRIGVYLIVAIAVIVAILFWPFKGQSRGMIAALSAAALFNLVWSVTAGPQLSGYVDGFLPDTTNQLVPLRYTFGNFVHYRVAVSLWAEQISFQLGSRPLVTVAVLGGALLTIILRRKSITLRNMTAALAVAAIALALYTIMYARLNSLEWPSSRRVYYWIPSAVAIALATAFVVAGALAGRPRARPIVLSVLAVLLISNLIALPSHASIVNTGEQRPQILESRLLRDCIRAPGVALSGTALSPAAARVCYQVRRAAFPQRASADSVPRAAANPQLYCRNIKRP